MKVLRSHFNILLPPQCNSYLFLCVPENVVHIHMASHKYCINALKYIYIELLLVFVFTDASKFAFDPLSLLDPKLFAYFFLFHEYL